VSCVERDTPFLITGYGALDVAGEFAKIPVNLSAFLASPTSIAISRRSNVLAVTIPVTSGVMVQAFRITDAGLTPITINGQLTAARGSVSVSPDGTFILVGNTAVNQSRFQIWKYNTATQQYDSFLAGDTDASRFTSDFDWLDDTRFVRSLTYQSGSTYRGGVEVFRIDAAAAPMLFQRLDTSYRGATVRVSPDKKNFVHGSYGGVNITDNYYWDGANGISYVGRSSATGAARVNEYLTNSLMLTGRSGASPGVRTKNILNPSGPNATVDTATQVQDFQSVYVENIRRLPDSNFLIHNVSTTFYHDAADGNGYVQTTLPSGLEQLSSQFNWSYFSESNFIAAYSTSAKDVRVYKFTPGLEKVTFLQAGPMGDAFAGLEINRTANLFALGTMGDAFVTTFEPQVIRALAVGPMGDAAFNTVGQHFINLAIAPMGDAWAWIPNENMTLVDTGPMGDAFATTQEFTGIDALAIAPMGDGLITFSPQWQFLEAVGPMGDASFDIPNVYVNALDATGPMGDATFDIPNVYFRSLFALGPMGDATARFEKFPTVEAVAVAPMGDAFVSIRLNGTRFVDIGPMGDASFDIPNVYVEALDALGPMGEATVDIEVPKTGILEATGPMGDASIGLQDIDYTCRRRSMMIIQVF